MRVKCLSLWLLLVLVMAPPAFAQSTGTILGTVRDPSGAVLPGVAVTVVDAGTGSSRTVTTDGQGNYVVPNLPIGTYDITAELVSFDKLLRP